MNFGPLGGKRTSFGGRGVWRASRGCPVNPPASTKQQVELPTLTDNLREHLLPNQDAASPPASVAPKLGWSSLRRRTKAERA